MEMTLSAFDALHPITLGLLISAGAVATALALSFYAQEVREYNQDIEDYERALDDYGNPDTPNVTQPTEPKAPWRPLPYAVVGLSIVLTLVIWMFCALSMSMLESNYYESRILIAQSIEMDKPVRNEVRELSKAWPEIVKVQKTTGSTGEYSSIINKFNSVTNNIIDEPEDYTVINEYIDLCFNGSANLDALNEVLEFHPASQSAFVREWRNAAYQSNYSSKLICAPDQIFSSLGVWPGLF